MVRIAQIDEKIGTVMEIIKCNPHRSTMLQKLNSLSSVYQNASKISTLNSERFPGDAPMIASGGSAESGALIRARKNLQQISLTEIKTFPHKSS